MKALGATLAAALLAVLCDPFFPGGAEIVAQAPPGPPLFPMRHFVHVFVAFGLAWLLVLFWAIRIVRQLRRVEERLTTFQETP